MTEVIFNGFDYPDLKVLEVEFLKEFPNAVFNRTVVLNEHPHSHIDITIPFIDLTKFIGTPRGIATAANFLEKSPMKDNVDGWVGLCKWISPGNELRLENLRKLAQDFQPGKVSLRIAGRFRSADGRWPSRVWIINEEEPDDNRALLACFGPLIERASLHLEKKGATFASEPRVEILTDKFKISWRNHEPNGDLLAFFNFSGRQIGDWVAENITDQQLINAFVELMGLPKVNN